MKYKKSRFGAGSKMALAATMMTIPLCVEAGQPNADAELKQKYSASFHKMSCPCLIAGSYEKHTVYKNAAGKYFWMDPTTGDQKFVSANVVIKTNGADRSK